MVPFISIARLSGAAILVTALAALGITACQQGAQGDRCNPNLIQSGGATPQYNEDECNKGAGLSCQVPPTCVIAVCCPSSPPYSDPNCACFANPGASCACTTPGALAAWEAAEDAGADSGGGTVDSGSDSAPTPDAAQPTKDSAAE